MPNFYAYDASYRSYIPGAIAGPQLGEAAHRLVKNTLNIKSNNTSPGLLEQPFQHIPGHHTSNRVRSPGPSAYGKYNGDDTSSYYGNYNNHPGMMSRPRFPFSSNGGQNERQNFRIQDRSQYQEQFHNMKAGFSAVTMEGVRSKAAGVGAPKSPITMLSRQPNSGPTPNIQHQFVQNIGPPIPPPKWITKAPAVNGIYVRHQETSMGGAYDKQTKKVYQVKMRHPQDMPEYGEQ